MNRAPRLALALLASFCVALLATRAPAADDISAMLEPLVKKHCVPALGGAIVDLGGLRAVGAFGKRRADRDEPVTKNDKWHLGSCTKSMTATLAAILVERGDLSWDLKLKDAYPKLKVDAGYREVTLAQLLTNRGGLPTDLSAHGLWGRLWQLQSEPPAHRQALAEGVLAHPPKVGPGTYLYSNAGFSIAGGICERVSKKAYEELIAKEMFVPLGMTSAGFGAPGKVGKFDQPCGHSTDGTPVSPGPAADNPLAIAPAGRVHCTLEDWARYVRLHLRGAKGRATPEKTPLLAPKTIQILHKAPDAGGGHYAFGWSRPERSWAGGQVLTHSGSNTMWYCVVWAAPERGFAVLATCNQGGNNAAMACDAVAATLIRYHATRRSGNG
ncbi:MAG: serine hydrolase domain-containing protein [Planctomycetota bacterium]